MFDPLGFSSLFLSLEEKCTVSMGEKCGCWCADGSTVTVTYGLNQIGFDCPEKEEQQ